MRKTAPVAAAVERCRHFLRIGLFAGLASGLAEVLWIWVYAAGADANAATVARAISEAVGLGGGANAVPPARP